MGSGKTFCQCGKEIHGSYTRKCPACNAILKPASISTGFLIQILGILAMVGGLAAALWYLLG